MSSYEIAAIQSSLKETKKEGHAPMEESVLEKVSITMASRMLNMISYSRMISESM